MLSKTELAERIRGRGLPDVVARIATEGGETVSPALSYRAEAVFRDPAETVMTGTAEDLVPLWSCGATHAFAGRGRYLMWSPEDDGPSAVFETFAQLVRELLTDLWEDEADDAERARIAHLLLPASDAAAALVPAQR